MRHDSSSKNFDLIADALGSSDVEDRRQATQLLAHLEATAALPLLLRALGDDDWRVRKEATQAARAFGGDRALVQALVKVIGRDDDARDQLDNVGLRNAAVDVLAAAGPAATPVLAVALGGLDADGRKLAIEALGRSRDPAAVDPLAYALGDVDENVRQGALEALATLGPAAPERVGERLLGALDDADPVIRLAALRGLSSLGVAIPWTKLAPLLADASVRAAALEAAALSHAPEAAGVVVAALVDAQPSGVAAALAAVARLAEGPLRPQVAEALAGASGASMDRLVALASDEAEPADRRGTALAIAALARAPGVLEASIEALGDDRLDTQARAALGSLGPAALPALVARLGDVATPPASRAEVVDLVASMALEQDPGRVPWAELLAALRAAAGDVDRRLATRALAALARVGTIDDLELLASASLSADRALAWAGEAALSRLVTRFPGAARTFFDRLVGDEAWTLPLAALLGALSAMGKARPDDMGFLAHAATSGGPAARRAAVAAAAQIGGAVALEVLSFALADEEPDVQLAAARGL
ncbi:MAG TPA: HEAT repeat domain-containing protein, partial [Byssovorax sp.]